MLKKLVILAFLGVLAALALPLSNLVIGAPSVALDKAAQADPALAKLAPVFEKKCVNCHSDKGKIPFYANFPIASSIIQNDIDRGTRYLDMLGEFAPAPGHAVNEAVLAKLERSLDKGDMPPLPYLAMHWDSGLSGAEQTEIRQWIQDTRKKHYATPDAPAEVQTQALQPLPQKVELDPVKVALGDKLYHDKRLSGDDTISCASCHDLGKGGTDQLQFSKGIRGQVGDINAPTTFNSRHQILQFWDGRANDLQDQAGGPVVNPIEMGSNFAQVVEKLGADEAFVAEFTAAYPDGLSEKNITHAIAEFEKSLDTPNDAFDKYLRGDDAALNAEQKAGLKAFVAHDCATCHVGKAIGGQSFEYMGRERDYFADRGKTGTADMGRFNFTKKEVDRHKFKVPTLRNLSLTAPYFHDGSTSDLAKAVELMAKYQNKAPLSPGERDQIVAFLLSLKGELNGKAL